MGVHFAQGVQLEEQFSTLYQSLQARQLTCSWEPCMMRSNSPSLWFCDSCLLSVSAASGEAATWIVLPSGRRICRRRRPVCWPGAGFFSFMVDQQLLDGWNSHHSWISCFILHNNVAEAPLLVTMHLRNQSAQATATINFHAVAVSNQSPYLAVGSLEYELPRLSRWHNLAHCCMLNNLSCGSF